MQSLVSVKSTVPLIHAGVLPTPCSANNMLKDDAIKLVFAAISRARAN